VLIAIKIKQESANNRQQDAILFASLVALISNHVGLDAWIVIGHVRWVPDVSDTCAVGSIDS
jgi:hypothetical protein